MSILVVTLITALRAACIALIAVGVGVCGVRYLRALRTSTASVLVWLLLLVLLMPAMTMSSFGALSKTATIGRFSELHYSMFVLMRMAPLAMLFVWLFPPSLSTESLRSFELMSPLPWLHRLRWRIAGYMQEFRSLFCVMFLLVFQEFDLAACWNARSWTITLFDAQAGGLALGESLKMMIWPLAIEGVILALLLTRGSVTSRQVSRDLSTSDRGAMGEPMAVTLIVLTFGFFSFLGPMRLLSAGVKGLPIALENFALTREVTNSMILALVSSISAWLLACWAEGNRVRVMTLALPGLLGSLVLSLILLAVFQVPPLHLLRGSPLPVLLALILMLMPCALFVRHILSRATQSEAAHLALLSGARSVRWQLTKRPALWGGALLFLQAYGDFTANSLLAPPALTSAFSRIFNLMHYGQTSVLSAMLLITLTVPLMALLLTTFISRIYATRRDQ